MANIPVIENIHQKVHEFTVNSPEKFDMSDWHKEAACGTTHCRAGTVTHLAGEAGRNLEEATSTAFAAMAIYAKSSTITVSPVRFYEDNKTALADIERCAKEEKGE